MGALQGIRILDISTHFAGPYSCTVLADMGADVIRVERPGGDDDRRLGHGMLNGDSTIFVSRARNKRSLTLNLETPGGRDIIHKLVRLSDVVVENYGSPMAERLGVDYDTLKKLKPAIVEASVSAFGSWGPSAGKVGFDSVIQAASGVMSFTGFPDDERPVRPQVTWVDYSTGLHVAVGIMVALWHRDKTGEGQHLEVALYDSAANLIGMQGAFADYLVFGWDRPKTGNTVPYIYADAFKAKDGWILISCARDGVWRRFTPAIGREDMAADPRFATDMQRGQNHEAIDQTVRPWVAQRTVAEVATVMEKARVPCQKVNSIPDLVNDPHLKAREMLLDIDYPGKGKVPVPGIAIKMFNTPGEYYRRPPLPGEHNEEILTTLLGYTADQVQALKSQGTI